MDEKEFIEFLHRSLEDKDVQEKILGIIKNDTSNLDKADNEGKKGELKKQIATEKALNNELQEQVDKQREENNRLLQELNTIKNKNKDYEVQLKAAVNENNDLNEKIRQQENQLKLQLQAIENYKMAIRELQEKITELDNSLNQNEQENCKLKQSIAEYQKKYKRFEDIERIYSKISSEKRSALGENIFRQADLETLFANGLQKENIMAIWNYVKDEYLAERLSKEELEKFNFLLNNFIFLYNLTVANNKWQLQKVNCGDSFDEFKHSRTKDSNPAGKITEICMPGYYQVDSGKIIMKTLVKVTG